MSDIYHEWGSDLAVGAGGDLALASGADISKQRILRRLLTNPGDYLWHLNYGGGLATFVGQPAQPNVIEAIIRTQLALEKTVAADPVPRVSVTLADAANGYVVADITFTDQESKTTISLNVNTP